MRLAGEIPCVDLPARRPLTVAPGVQKGASAAGPVVLSACERSSPAARSGRGADQGGPRPAHSGLAGFRPCGGRVREAGLGSGNTLQLPGTAARRRSLGARDQAADPAGRWRRNGAGGGGVAGRTLRPSPGRGARSRARPRIPRDGPRPDPQRAVEHGPDPGLVREALAPLRSARGSAPGPRRRARRDPPAHSGVQSAGRVAGRRGGTRCAGNASASSGLPRSEKAAAPRARRRALRQLRRRVHGLARSSFVDADRAPRRHQPGSERGAGAGRPDAGGGRSPQTRARSRPPSRRVRRDVPALHRRIRGDHQRRREHGPDLCLARPVLDPALLQGRPVGDLARDRRPDCRGRHLRAHPPGDRLPEHADGLPRRHRGRQRHQLWADLSGAHETASLAGRPVCRAPRPRRAPPCSPPRPPAFLSECWWSRPTAVSATSGSSAGSACCSAGCAPSCWCRRCSRSTRGCAERPRCGRTPRRKRCARWWRACSIIGGRSSPSSPC